LRERRSSRPAKTEDVLARPTAAPTPKLGESGTPAGAIVLVVLPLFALGLLLLSASAVPPRRIPWVVVAESLSLHRSDLAAAGVAAIALALLCLNIAVLF
jgi:hypothetical protein